MMQIRLASMPGLFASLVDHHRSPSITVDWRFHSFDMMSMVIFMGYADLNEDISSLDTSSVRDMTNMF